MDVVEFFLVVLVAMLELAAALWLWVVVAGGVLGGRWKVVVDS